MQRAVLVQVLGSMPAQCSMKLATLGEGSTAVTEGM
jgi:hypothetical protein